VEMEFGAGGRMQPGGPDVEDPPVQDPGPLKGWRTSVPNESTFASVGVWVKANGATIEGNL